MVGGFDGEEAVEELGGGDAVEGGSMVGKGDDGVAGKADKEVAVAVFEGVVENVVKDARQGVGVEGAPDGFVAEPNVRRQAALLKGAVETGQAFGEGVVEADGAGRMRGVVGEDDRVAEEFFAKLGHGVGAVGDDGQVALGVGAGIFALEQVEGAANGGERRAQVVGDVGDGGFQLAVAVFVAQALAAQFAEGVVDGAGQLAHVCVAAGEGDGGVGVGTEAVVKLLGDGVGGAAQQDDFDGEDGNDEHEHTDDEGGSHGHSPLRGLFEVFFAEKQIAKESSGNGEKQGIQRPARHVVKHLVADLDALGAWQKIVQNADDGGGERAGSDAVDGDVGHHGLNLGGGNGEGDHDQQADDAGCGFVGQVHSEGDADGGVGEGEQHAVEEDQRQLSRGEHEGTEQVPGEQHAWHQAGKKHAEGSGNADEGVGGVEGGTRVPAGELAANGALVVVGADGKMDDDGVDDANAGQHAEDAGFGGPLVGEAVVVEHFKGGGNEGQGGGSGGDQAGPEGFAAQQLDSMGGKQFKHGAHLPPET